MAIAMPNSPPCRPWCGAFVHEAFYQAGVHLSARIMDPNTSFADAVNHQHGLRAISNRRIRAGDIVFFILNPNMPAGDHASHEALATGRPGYGEVPTAEGNVGQHVVLTHRGVRFIVLAARVTKRPAT